LRADTIRELPEAEFISVATAATIASVNHMTIRRALDRAEMKRYQIGRKILIKRADFRAWLESVSVTNAA
jgi:excisionase family DNA binding protein